MCISSAHVTTDYYGITLLTKSNYLDKRAETERLHGINWQEWSFQMAKVSKVLQLLQTEYSIQ